MFYTRKGDKGFSKFGNYKISKDNYIIDLLGELDELNSLVGLSKNYVRRYKKKLENIQNDLFIIQAQISYILYPKFNPPKIKPSKIKALESEINKIENKIKPKPAFIIPGKNKESGWLHYLRTVCRRVERKLIYVNKRNKIDPIILSYINRLSSYFYSLAREIVYLRGLKEDYPSYK
jgi:cob(I)alamin adenosyltransferase